MSRDNKNKKKELPESFDIPTKKKAKLTFEFQGTPIDVLLSSATPTLAPRNKVRIQDFFKAQNIETVEEVDDYFRKKNASILEVVLDVLTEELQFEEKGHITRLLADIYMDYRRKKVAQNIAYSNKAKKTLISASALKDSGAMAHIGYPLGPYTYHPPRALITYIHHERAYLSDDILQYCRSVLRSPCAQWTYKTSKHPENNYTRVNLDSLVGIICELANRIKPGVVTMHSAQAISPEISMCIGAQSSSPEPALLHELNGVFALLFGSEAKPITASHSEAMSQGVQIAGDGALHLAKVLNDHNEEIVIPYVTVAGDTVQFSVVYLMPASYPCPVKLSRELQITDAGDIDEIASWLNAIARFCIRIVKDLCNPYSKTHPPPASRPAAKPSPVDLIDVVFGGDVDGAALPELQRVSPSSFDENALQGVKVSTVVELDATCVLKPIRAPSSVYCHSRVQRLMRHFHLLDQHSEARKYVHFPLGVIGYPDETEQNQLRKFVGARLKELDKWRRRNDYQARVYEPGHPFVVFSFLDANDGWMVATDCPTAHSKALCEQLQKALSSAEEAGVIHLDVQLQNLMYRVGCGGSVELRIIDWDDSCEVGHTIPLALYKSMQEMPIVYPLGQVCATAAYHQKFLADIHDALGQPSVHSASRTSSSVGGRSSPPLQVLSARAGAGASSSTAQQGPPAQVGAGASSSTAQQGSPAQAGAGASSSTALQGPPAQTGAGASSSTAQQGPPAQTGVGASSSTPQPSPLAQADAPRGPDASYEPDVRIRLSSKQADVFPVPPDGNCLFHALCHGTEIHPSQARMEIAQYLNDHPFEVIGSFTLEDVARVVHSNNGVFDLHQHIARLRAGIQWGGNSEIAVFSKIDNCIVRVFHIWSNLRAGPIYEEMYDFGDPLSARREVNILLGASTQGGKYNHYDALVLKKDA